MKKFLVTFIIVSILVPQVVFAAWWNPFSWFNSWSFTPVEHSSVEIELTENKTLEKRILELERRLSVANDDNSTSTATTTDILAEEREIVIKEKKEKVVVTPPPVIKPVVKVETKPAVVTTSKPKIEEPITFTTPNGSVIDVNGNIISGPIKVASITTTNTATPGTKILTGEEIYSLVSQSVVLIKTSTGHGTGFVIENGKYTLTNAHVVGSDNKVTLTFENGMTTSGTVLGKNDANDIAVIFNNNLSLKAVKFGYSDSSSLMTGSDVYALGFPLDYINTITLTKGLVSANRQETSFGNFIQTDASIHPGNSGGPLVNNKGEVVGINTSGIVAQGSVGTIGGTGIGFAIPIETAKLWIPSLSKNGQSQAELYPIGSTQTILKSLKTKIDINYERSCNYLGLQGDELTTCKLYRDYYDDYSWTIIADY